MSNEKQKLKSGLKSFYAQKELSSYQLERLQQKSRSPLWLAASLSFAVSLVVMLNFFMGGDYPSGVMKEIVYNHNKNLNVEIKTSDLGQIQKSLAKLDFTLIASARISSNEWEIVGARYCSLDGRIAAQIKLKNLSTGQYHTYYQARIDSSIEELDANEFIDGAEVKVWKEKGLLLGIAGP